jgi:hypothetical protein
MLRNVSNHSCRERKQKYIFGGGGWIGSGLLEKFSGEVKKRYFRTSLFWDGTGLRLISWLPTLRDKLPFPFRGERD